MKTILLVSAALLAVMAIAVLRVTPSPPVVSASGIEIASITPSKGLVGYQVPVTITGIGFPDVGDCEPAVILVLFNGASAFPLEQPTSAGVRVVAPAFTEPGPVDVTVMNTCDGTSDTVVGGFTYTSPGIVSGSIPRDGGFGLFVFGGGTNDDLVRASDCPEETAAFWATDGGEFVTFIPGVAIVAVNEAWDALFRNEIPYGTALIGRCV